MRHYNWLLLLLALICAKAQAFQPSIEIIEQFDDVRLIAFIKEGDIKNYPLWQPLTDQPPLSIQAAIAAIKKQYKERDSALAAGSINEIELREMTNHKGYWHYLIKIKSERGVKPEFDIYLVLMNGKVIPAIIETESYK